MIDNEDPKKILSDDKIVELLNEIGIDIARRTVAKYREALGIPSSVQRRRQKRDSEMSTDHRARRMLARAAAPIARVGSSKQAASSALRTSSLPPATTG